jgi:enoyl-CoA hydratase
MTENEKKIGQVRHETHGRILKIVIDNTAKRNAVSPEMMEDLSHAFTLLDRSDDLWVGVLCAEGDHFTAGLDMPKFFSPKAIRLPRPEGAIDPFGLSNICRKAIVAAVQGITYTVGIEIALAGDIVIAAADSRFCQMESKRGIARARRTDLQKRPARDSGHQISRTQVDRGPREGFDRFHSPHSRAGHADRRRQGRHPVVR